MDGFSGGPGVTSEIAETPSEEVEYCYGHPKTPTKLHCSRCDRPICGRCAIPASVGQHCPECVAEARRTAPKVRSAMAATAPVVMTILGINIAMFLGQQLIPGLTEGLLMDPSLVAAGEYWRLITPIFLHAGILHIALNSYVFYSFGPNVEQAFGKVRFALMYLAAGFLGNAFSFAFPPDSRSLGASGAVFGMAGVLLVYLFKRRTSTFVAQYLRSIGFFIIANLILGFVLISFIDNFAHIGGLVAGVVLGFGFDRDDRAMPVTTAISLAVVLGLGVVLVALKVGGAF